MLTVVKYLHENQNATLSDLADWADSQEQEMDSVADSVIHLAVMFSRLMCGGKREERGICITDVSPEEVEMGMAVEMEHTTDVVVATKIALDHLAEIPDYYTRLKAMEEEAGVKH